MMQLSYEKYSVVYNNYYKPISLIYTSRPFAFVRRELDRVGFQAAAVAEPYVVVEH